MSYERAIGGRAASSMRISILAWGSLVWDRKDLAVVADFAPAGPWLPVEFCRVSRDGRLTLVIDEAFGAPCITYSALSTFDNLEAAIEDLRIREGMPSRKGVGFVAFRHRRQRVTALERHPRAVKAVTEWTCTQGFDAAIWTALASNFEEETHEPFSVEAAIRHLEARDEDTLGAALRYIRQAPPEIKTPVRDAVDIRWPR
jgi:hypothetical protein